MVEYRGVVALAAHGERQLLQRLVVARLPVVDPAAGVEKGAVFRLLLQRPVGEALGLLQPAVGDGPEVGQVVLEQGRVGMDLQRLEQQLLGLGPASGLVEKVGVQGVEALRQRNCAVTLERAACTCRVVAGIRVFAVRRGHMRKGQQGCRFRTACRGGTQP